MNREKMVEKAKQFLVNREDWSDDFIELAKGEMADFAIQIINSHEFLEIQSVFAYEAGIREVDMEVAKAIKKERKRTAAKLRGYYQQLDSYDQWDKVIEELIAELETE